MTGTWFTGWATGDIVTAAEFKKGAGSIFDTILGASAATIDVTSIPVNYAHLLITMYLRNDQVANTAQAYMRFNADATATYECETLTGTGNAAPTSGEILANTGLLVGTVPASSAAANLFGAAQVFIPHYAGAVNTKSYVALGSVKSGITTGLLSVALMGGGWRGTAAINRITIFPNGGNFVAGSRLTIHALGA